MPGNRPTDQRDGAEAAPAASKRLARPGRYAPSMSAARHRPEGFPQARCPATHGRSCCDCCALIPGGSLWQAGIRSMLCILHGTGSRRLHTHHQGRR